MYELKFDEKAEYLHESLGISNKRADELMDKLRFKEQYNEAYNQGVRDAAESAGDMMRVSNAEYYPHPP